MCINQPFLFLCVTFFFCFVKIASFFFLKPKIQFNAIAKKEIENICNICRLVKYLSDFNNNKNQLLSFGTLNDVYFYCFLYMRTEHFLLLFLLQFFSEPPSKPSTLQYNIYFLIIITTEKKMLTTIQKAAKFTQLLLKQ